MRIYPDWHILHEGPYESVHDALLAGRNLSPEDLAVGPEALHEPHLLSDLTRAVERIHTAIRGDDNIVIFGDYDVDGVTSTALFLDFLERVGARCDYILPDRHRDGYGMKPPGVRRAVEKEAGLLITVDNGISAFEGVEEAIRHGIDVIVIDHHRQSERLPAAHSIVNPNRLDSTYPFGGLAGVGVTFKVVQALSAEFIGSDERRAYLNSLLDLVALGSVADVAPVLDENRVLIRYGMKVLERTPRPGLQQLKEIARCAAGPIGTAAISFYLGPRLNSAGRLATADLALRLLRAGTTDEARSLAAELDGLNGRRRELQQRSTCQAQALVTADDLDRDRIIVILGEDWNPGVIGLMASNLAESHHRPAVVCTDASRDGTYVGSARSIPAYDITEGITNCAPYLSNYGGHRAAAGFSLDGGRFELFRAALVDHANEKLTAADLRAELTIDLCLRSADLDLETVQVVSSLEPFGTGNQVPLFAARGMEVQSTSRVGKDGEHLKLALDAEGRRLNAVWWRQGQQADKLNRGDRMSVAFELEEDTFRGRGTIQLVIRDMYQELTDTPSDVDSARSDAVAEVA